jgi:hypothetical protein
MCGRLSTGKIAAMHNENLHSILFSCEDMLGQDTLWHASHIKLYSDIYIYADPLLILRCLFQKSPKEIVGQAAETTWYRQRPQHSLPLAHRTNEKRTLAVGIGTASKISTVDRTQSTLATHWQHTGNTLANLVLIEKSRDITVPHGNHHDISGLLKSFSYKLWAHAGRGTYLSQTSHLAGPADSP